MWSGNAAQACSARATCAAACTASCSREASHSELQTLPGNDELDRYSEWLSWQPTTLLTQWSGCPGHRRHRALQSSQGLLLVLQALLLAVVQGESCRQRGAPCLGGSCTLSQESVQGQPHGVGLGPADRHGASVSQTASLHQRKPVAPWGPAVQLLRSGQLLHGSRICLAASNGRKRRRARPGHLEAPRGARAVRCDARE